MAKFEEQMDKIADGVAEGYQKIEDGVVDGYKKSKPALSTAATAQKYSPSLNRAKSTPPR